MRSEGDATATSVGGADRELVERLDRELLDFNTRATGIGNQRGLSVRVSDAEGLVAGLTGWTWGTCARIELVWVRGDQRRRRFGGHLLEAAEAEARTRGCTQILVSSMTFQAPDFYKRKGYVEFCRTEGIPTAGSAEVHMVKALRDLEGDASGRD
jgi:GNAT superfamily N-acetyltransferase